jgi:hypothetical protein
MTDTPTDSTQLQLPLYKNPYRPGAGHMPPHLAGREHEQAEFDRLLAQDTILENMVLTGLRGVGKTVLLETLKPRALQRGWQWAGTDLSETASVSEHNLALRLMTDLSVITSGITVDRPAKPSVGFTPLSSMETQVPLTFDVLRAVYDDAPGLVGDKIKSVLEFAWQHLHSQGRDRLIFAYDEAQNLSDNAERDQYPLSVMLDVFQSIQRKGIPFMLVLTGLPTLFPKLVEARTYAERMFHIVTIGRLSDGESREAILTPLDKEKAQIRFSDESVTMIVTESGGYPYFIQFLCREIYDIWLTHVGQAKIPDVPIGPIQLKLDQDFFAGRWAKVTDRQRQMLWVIAKLERGDDEFTILEVVSRSKVLLPKGFSASHSSQMLTSLAEQGLIYKNRFGKYTFAVPLLGQFILRTYDPPNELELPV